MTAQKILIYLGGAIVLTVVGSIAIFIIWEVLRAILPLLAGLFMIAIVLLVLAAVGYFLFWAFKKITT